ncbi:MULTISPECIES: DUF1707 domain-containing protein [Streptomyces]|uniref:DUF1707 domain-containing protein n=1 Tax=Streptomyces albus (strain ATCC 21838 / DSM 41398 / FERM P-419 / JCM 4703 / NBRC 107858) TaxID=1081613 RepID=A0A0B5EX30_STRA4|nr:DUF1707 domain-containing protein [Streptomyces sp. SCSIO ZS0520]AJE82682.1 hypothetical protein SLNWT_2306 [Streptomyces albus]AOU76995.1 hypothetical protein SLNHY_2304 [Streptomyces albus]AYN32771.1 hypothetical protein DUI70_2268 [Streptomyces albus]
MDLEKRPQPSGQPSEQTSGQSVEVPSRAPFAEPGEPPLRASDADRDRIADILREALAEGRLTPEEHSERIDSVYRAKTQGELEPLVRDLPGAHRGGPQLAVPGRPVPGTIPAEPDENLVAVFSASVRKGRWRVGRRTHAYAVFGSVEIDLSQAVFEYPQVVIKAVSVFGSVEVRVPENVSLRGSGGGVLGNFEVDTLDSAEPEAPVVYVEGVAVLGNIDAKAKRGKLISNLQRKLRGKGHGSHFGH